MLRGKLFKLIVVCFFCAVLHGGYSASAQTKPPQARKFDEFGDIALTDIKARLDNFAIQLQSEPQARGFIIVYRSRRDLPGLNNRLALRMKNYLVYSRGVSAQRLVTVDGGTALCLTQELWIAPAGSAPSPRSDAYSNTLTDTESARKFDEYYYSLPGDTEDAEGEITSGSSLEAFATALRNEPRSLAYIIVYPQYYMERRGESFGNGMSRPSRRLHFDPPGTSAKILKAVKSELVGKYGIAPSRVELIDGGYRRWRQVELWVVPRGVHAPVATPNTFPNSRARIPS